MKRQSILFTTVVAALAGTYGMPRCGFADIIILSQEHHVRGEAGGPYAILPGGTKVTYNETSDSPLSVSVTGTCPSPYGAFYPVTAWSRAGGFSVGTDAQNDTCGAYARSEYVFKLTEGVYEMALRVKARGGTIFDYWGSQAGFTLYDITADMELADFWGPSHDDWLDSEYLPHGYDWAYDVSDLYSVDPAHTYRMTIWSAASGGDVGSFAGLNVTGDLSVHVVPLPGAALLGVLGIGYAGMSLRRKAQLHELLGTAIRRDSVDSLLVSVLN